MSKRCFSILCLSVILMLIGSIHSAWAQSPAYRYEAFFTTVNEGPNTMYVDFYLRLLAGQTSEKLGSLTLFIDYTASEMTYVSKLADYDGPWDDANPTLPGSYDDVYDHDRGSSGRFSIEVMKSNDAPVDGGLPVVACPTRIARVKFTRSVPEPVITFNAKFVEMKNWNLDDITSQLSLSTVPASLCHDFGDAPIAYDTPTPAYHDLQRMLHNPLWLGPADDFPDGEPSTNTSSEAKGDDQNGDGPDDEDGVTMPAVIYRGQSTTIPISYSIPPDSTAYIIGWFDWNGDGDFSDAGEMPVQLTETESGVTSVQVTSDPGSSYTGLTFARFRISSTPDMTSQGGYEDGEVEDYAFLLQEVMPCPSDFTINPASACTNQPVTFTYAGSDGPTSFTWSFGDGGTASTNPATHIYITPGTYTVQLQTGCPDGSTGSTTHDLVIGRAASDYTVTVMGTPSSPVGVGTSIEFSATADPNDAGLTYSWDFGDGTTATGNPVTKVYESVNTFHINLTVTTPSCGDHTFNDIKTVEVIHVNRPPEALDDLFTTTVNMPVMGQVLTNDSDPDGDALQVNPTPVLMPLHGTVLLNGDGTFTYAPETDFVGVDLFSYKVCDNGSPSLCNTALVSITTNEAGSFGFDYGSDALPAARHRYNREVWIGLFGQVGPWVDAETSPDDGSENDGIEFGPTDPGSNTTVKVSVSKTGVIAAWIDFNRDGDWNDSGENIITPRSINGGEVTTFNFAVPNTALAGMELWSRFRYAAANAAGQLPDLAVVADPTGFQDQFDGEVQDYHFRLTSVELTSFTATVTDRGVQLDWKTASETENLGFYLYRSEAEVGQYHQINASLIPGAGVSASVRNYSYVDDSIEGGTVYFYKLADVDYSGRMSWHGPVHATKQAPEQYILEQNFPNPFNPETRILFRLKEAGTTYLAIYNLRGQMVRQLANGHLDSGVHSVTWDGKDANGKMVPSGVYLYLLRVNGFETIRKMEFIK